MPGARKSAETASATLEGFLETRYRRVSWLSRSCTWHTPCEPLTSSCLSPRASRLCLLPLAFALPLASRLCLPLASRLLPYRLCLKSCSAVFPRYSFSRHFLISRSFIRYFLDYCATIPASMNARGDIAQFMKVRITRQPIGVVQGVSLKHYRLGEVYELPPSLAEYLVMEQFAIFEMRDRDRPLCPSPRNAGGKAELLVSTLSAVRSPFPSSPRTCP